MNQLTRFALSMCKVGCIGFGGGSALIPVIEEEVVKTQKIEKKENCDKDVIVASITPGALPVEIAASIGKRNFGARGMFLGAFMMAFPGAFLTVLLLTVLSMAQTELLTVIETASIGVSAFILCLLWKYIHGMLKGCMKEGKSRLNKAIIVMSGTFLLSCGKNLYQLIGLEGTPVFAVSTLHILLVAFFFIFYTRYDYRLPRMLVTVVLSGIYLLSYGKAQLISNIYVTRMVELIMLLLSVYGIVQEMKKPKKATVTLNRENIWKDVLTWLVILLVALIPAVIINRDAIRFLLDGLLSTLMSFGGGDAYLTIAEGLFVDGGFVTGSQYYGQIVSIVNMLPGSILCKTLSGIGYYAGLNAQQTVSAGIAFAVTGFACSIAASCGFYIIIYHLYDSLHSLSPIRMISRWIRPIIAGLLLNIMLSIFNQCAFAASTVQHSSVMIMVCVILLTLVDIWFVQTFKKKSFLALLINLVVVFLIF